MTLLDKERLIPSPVERIGQLIPKGKLTLVLGLGGTGKSTSILKALIQDNIKPIWFNFDESETPLDISMIDCFSGKYCLNFIFGKYDDVKNKTIVIDTYERLWEKFINLNKQKAKSDRMTSEELKIYLVNYLEHNCKINNNTIIVIAHSKEYVGKDGIFTDNETLVRRAYEVIAIEVKVSTSKKEIQNGNAETQYTYVKKGRGYTGKRVIINWMID